MLTAHLFCLLSHLPMALPETAAPAPVALSAVPQDGKKKRKARPTAKARQDKPEPVMLVSVDGVFQIVSKTALKSLKAEAARDYKNEVKAYNEAKKAAAKARQKFEGARPKRKSVKTHGSFKSEEDAKKRQAALENKGREKGKK